MLIPDNDLSTISLDKSIGVVPGRSLYCLSRIDTDDFNSSIEYFWPVNNRQNTLYSYFANCKWIVNSVGCPETSVNNYKSTPRNITEQQQYQICTGEIMY
jgi:hypothetical protein